MLFAGFKYPHFTACLWYVVQIIVDAFYSFTIVVLVFALLQLHCCTVTMVGMGDG